MNKLFLTPAAGALALFFGISPVLADESASWGFAVRGPTYAQVIEKVVHMPFERALQARAGEYGLNVVNLTWEDTGRYQGSAVGPNISDLTLQVREQTPEGTRTHLLPVIRHPNFADETADLPADKLWVRVGNQKKGGELEARPLSEVLKNLKQYLSNPEGLKGSGNFLADRDTHFLVSAQHVFLPLPKSGKAEFNPVLYNYQSYPGSPAVLTLLVTREGTSARVIENKPGDQSFQGWGQQLFFNNAGQKTTFTAERRSDVKARIDRQGETRPGDQGALEEGADMMMIVQVPLVQKQRPRPMWYGAMEGGDEAPPPPSAAPMAEMQVGKKGMRQERSDVERAVLGHGEDLGEFDEMGGLELVRDTRFPVRVTVQFYKATSNGVVSEQDLMEVASTIKRVYAEGDYVGSLVVPKSDQKRPTEWSGAKRPWGWARNAFRF